MVEANDVGRGKKDGLCRQKSDAGVRTMKRRKKDDTIDNRWSHDRGES